MFLPWQVEYRVQEPRDWNRQCLAYHYSQRSTWGNWAFHSWKFRLYISRKPDSQRRTTRNIGRTPFNVVLCLKADNFRLLCQESINSERKHQTCRFHWPWHLEGGTVAVMQWGQERVDPTWSSHLSLLSDQIWRETEKQPWLENVMVLRAQIPQECGSESLTSKPQDQQRNLT